MLGIRGARARRWKKKMLWTGLVVTLVISMAMVKTSFSASYAVLSAPVILDTAKTPGSTLSVDVSIEDVEKLFAYKFTLSYNATVLTATSVSSYAPFTVPMVSPILNNTGGWVYISQSMPMGEKVGFSTVDPEPIAKIDFTVNALGKSWLDLEYTTLGEPLGVKHILHIVVDGFFANVEVENHDIAITDLTAPSPVPVDEEVNVTITVENIGEFFETFDVSLYYGDPVLIETVFIETQTDISLTVGADTTLTFTWNTTAVAEGAYTLKAEASVVPGEYNVANNVRTVEVTVGEGGEDGAGAGQDYTLYILAAVVAVVVLATAVYLFKIRKPKTP